MSQIKAILIGAGNRGMNVYGRFAENNPDKIKFVAVADLDPERREKFKELHNLPDDMCFSNWREVFKRPKFADCVVISTLDDLHYEPTIAAAKAGYDMLLEKPMSPKAEECIEMERVIRENGVKAIVCHVLRYTPFFTKVKELIDGGKIGRMISIAHNENVGYWHMGHSFVRGKFNNDQTSSPMILAKSCHDMDLLYWLCGSVPRKISSFGHLTYFVPENAPEGAPEMCMDGCPAKDTCEYYAPNLYLTDNVGWPTSMISTDTSIEARTQALKTGEYGKCIFRCNNNVVDHQSTIIDFSNDVTVMFNMCGHTSDNNRTMKIMGTKGEIRGHLEKSRIELETFLTGEVETFDVSALAGHHSGGDEGIMRNLVEVIGGDGNNKTSVTESLYSHMMSFAAEKSRVSGKIIEFEEYMKEMGFKI